MALRTDEYLPIALLRMNGGRGSSNESVTITAPSHFDDFDAYQRQPKSSSLHNIHVQPCLSGKEATKCLQLAREYAANTGCWDQSSGRHINYNTVDFEVEDSEDLSAYLNEICFHSRIVQQLSEAFEIEEPCITFLDLFCSNYEATTSSEDLHQQLPTASTTRSTMDSLVMHRDGSLLSFTVLLSDPQIDFDGGGTTFECLKNVSFVTSSSVDTTINTSTSSTAADPYPTIVQFSRENGTVQPQKQGYCTLHSGKMLHGADVVTRGSRCVLVGFMDVAPFITDPGRLGEACRQWGRLDGMKRRYRRLQQHKGRSKSLPSTSSFSSLPPPPPPTTTYQFLPQKNKSYIPALGIPFPSAQRRADETYQRRHRLYIEDWFLHGALLPPNQRDLTRSMFHDENDGIIIL
jgi:hypothetical protein